MLYDLYLHKECDSSNSLSDFEFYISKGKVYLRTDLGSINNDVFFRIYQLDKSSKKFLLLTHEAEKVLARNNGADLEWACELLGDKGYLDDSNRFEVIYDQKQG